MKDTPTAQVDELYSPQRMIAFGLQHVLVMAASPIAAVFLMSKALGFDAALTTQLLSATFLVCGIGTLIQSFGPGGIGAKLPFVMLPGGAPIVLFILIAQQSDLPTASGAVILAAVLYFLIVPVFKRFLRYFPALVIGTMLLLVAVNLAQISGKLIAGTPGTSDFGNTDNLLLALITIAATVLFARLLHGMCRQLAILLGLVVGALTAALMGHVSVSGLGAGPLLALPSPFPFGPPRYDLIAALPLLLFTLISMVEATGQTIALNEVLGKESEAEQQREVPNTIRGDGLASLLGGIFGTSLIITSGENIGIIRATQVRSRYVTAVSGLFLILFGIFSPLSALISVIPGAVIGATGLVVFAIVGTMGIDMLRKVDLRNHAAMYVVATALAVGLLPIVVPGIYDQLPAQLRLLLSNGVAMGAVTAAFLNYVFIHLGRNCTQAGATPVQHS